MSTIGYSINDVREIIAKIEGVKIEEVEWGQVENDLDTGARGLCNITPDEPFAYVVLKTNKEPKDIQPHA